MGASWKGITLFLPRSLELSVQTFRRDDIRSTTKASPPGERMAFCHLNLPFPLKERDTQTNLQTNNRKTCPLTRKMLHVSEHRAATRGVVKKP